MADNRTRESRSALMARIGPRDTAPEMAVRRLLHRLGYRYRLHCRSLPGTPDIVLPSRRIAVFVHGCFWHAHGCSKGRPPKTRQEYWKSKLDRNRERDAEKRGALEAMGWQVVEIWQCQTRDCEGLTELIHNSLGPPGRTPSVLDPSSLA
jgi:DNA mismatch endonuclease (patch repair protein)